MGSSVAGSSTGSSSTINTIRVAIAVSFGGGVPIIVFGYFIIRKCCVRSNRRNED
jgi:hypothetical protein